MKRRVFGLGTVRYFRRHGARATLEALADRYHSYRKERRLRGLETLKVFDNIYLEGEWGRDETVSGPGSTLAYTENIRGHLPKIAESLNVRTLIDAPCGDFNWMSAVSLPQVSYIGIDIVQALVASNQSKYGDERRRFIHGNIIKDALPNGDLLMCRDCLFHLSYSDIFQALRNICHSDIKYLFTTTHLNNGFENRDIATGGARRIDLFSEPFCFPPDVLYRVEDYIKPFPAREMCVWTMDQVKTAVRF